MRGNFRPACLLTVVLACGSGLAALELPPRAHGEGPFEQLILRGVTLVDGTGAPPRSPVDIVIEGDRIVSIVTVGSPGVAIEPRRRPALAEGGREIDLTGSWVLPGFVDVYGHPGPEPAYGLQLMLAHGVTTVREPVCERGMESCLAWQKAADEQRVTSPRVVPWLHFGLGRPGLHLEDEADARRWVREAQEAGAAGIKFRGEHPEILAAALDEAEALGIPTACHHSQRWVARAGVRQTASQGLDLLEHFYGLPEALLGPGRLPPYPAAYDYGDEQERFAFAGELWRHGAAPGSELWREVVAELAASGLTMVPTLSLYEANRDLMRARRAEWHEDYTSPRLWQSFAPDRSSHAAHFFAWGSEQEATWRFAYRRWMRFLADFKNAGGRVVVGSDAGFMYSLYGFAYVRELELLREAGFSPLEVLRAATYDGARSLGLVDEVGSIEVGKKADLVIVEEDPLANLKVLYGTGFERLDGDGKSERVGGVRWTLRDGVLFDAPALLREIRRRVAEAKAGPASGLRLR